MTNRLRSGKIIPRNGATDVAAFKFYLDEVKCRPEYGAARVEEPLPEWMEKPSRTESKLQYDARFYQKEGIVFDCGARWLLPAPQSGRPGHEKHVRSRSQF